MSKTRRPAVDLISAPILDVGPTPIVNVGITSVDRGLVFREAVSGWRQISESTPYFREFGLWMANKGYILQGMQMFDLTACGELNDIYHEFLASRPRLESIKIEGSWTLDGETKEPKKMEKLAKEIKTPCPIQTALFSNMGYTDDTRACRDCRYFKDVSDEEGEEGDKSDYICNLNPALALPLETSLGFCNFIDSTKETK